MLLLAGLLTYELGRRTPLPRATLLLLLGIALGPWLRGVSPQFEHDWFPAIAHLALVMVGFLLGEKLRLSSLREHGREVLAISIAAVAITSLAVLVGLIALGTSIGLALVLAGIAPATAPAATADVVRQMGARGRFSDTLLGIVALDDAWGLFVFTLLLAAAVALGGGSSAAATLLVGLREIVGAIVLGVILGLPAALLTGRLRPGEPMLVEALGLVLLCAGIGLWSEVSILVAALTMGAVVANVARHHTRPFHAIERIEWPFMILFFVFAGSALHLDALGSIGVVGGAYILLRALGRVLGAWAGARLCGADLVTRRWMGLALMPQAGVALGMALVVQQRMPALGDVVLPLVIASTVVFEVIGPVLTRQALQHAGARVATLPHG